MFQSFADQKHVIFQAFHLYLVARIWVTLVPYFLQSFHQLMMKKLFTKSFLFIIPNKSMSPEKITKQAQKDSDNRFICRKKNSPNIVLWQLESKLIYPKLFDKTKKVLHLNFSGKAYEYLLSLRVFVE